MDSDLGISHEKLFGEIMSKIEEIAIPFVGWVKLQDNEDEVSMLRDQIRMQQNEIHRLIALLKEHGVKHD